MAKKKRKPPKKKDYLDVVNRAKEQGINKIILALSGGRDSVAMLDICSEHFDEVKCFHMYFVKGLSFIDKYLDYLAKRYDVEIYQCPSWTLSRFFREGFFRHESKSASSVPSLSQKDIYRHVRNRLGLEWIANGAKQSDSIERMAQIKRVDGINHQRKLFWPLAVWSHHEVQGHLTRQRIPSSPEYELGLTRDRSFGTLWNEDILVIKKHFPEDYKKIKRRFPLIEAQVIKYEREQREEKQRLEAEGEEAQETA